MNLPQGTVITVHFEAYSDEDGTTLIPGRRIPSRIPSRPLAHPMSQVLAAQLSSSLHNLDGAQRLGPSIGTRQISGAFKLRFRLSKNWTRSLPVPSTATDSCSGLIRKGGISGRVSLPRIHYSLTAVSYISFLVCR